MTDDDTPGQPSGPDLHKSPDPPQQRPSIWQPLDGSAPPTPPPADPRVGAWGQPHAGAPVPPHHAAAAYRKAGATAAPGDGVFTLASWGNRAGAFILDTILYGLIGVVVLLVATSVLGLSTREMVDVLQAPTDEVRSGDAGQIYAVLLVAALVVGLLPAIFLARWNGQTPGKRALNLRVMRADGGPMTFRVALMRELIGRGLIVGTLGALTFYVVTFLNYLWPLWDAERRTGHDALAKTRVVQETKTPKPPSTTTFTR